MFSSIKLSLRAHLLNYNVHRPQHLAKILRLQTKHFFSCFCYEMQALDLIAIAVLCMHKYCVSVYYPKLTTYVHILQYTLYILKHTRTTYTVYYTVYSV